MEKQKLHKDELVRLLVDYHEVPYRNRESEAKELANDIINYVYNNTDLTYGRRSNEKQ